MSDDAKVAWAIFAFVLLAVFVIVGAGIWLAVAQCESRWARSGLKSEWGFPQGCMVQRKDGAWVPSAAMRNFFGDDGT